ncbi:MAG: hypothetical protein K0Q59_4857, partial [Paenibacillus sp.]|nr:hypothetical protein [Paenibacillus sp.]
MSGKQVSAIVRYGVDEQGRLQLARTIIWPTLRTIPNHTHASLQRTYTGIQVPKITVDGALVHDEFPYEIAFDGVLHIRSRTEQGLEVRRTLFPSTRKKAYIEKIELANKTSAAIRVAIEREGKIDTARGTKGIYLLEIEHDASEQCVLQPEGTLAYYVRYTGRKRMEPDVQVDGEEELSSRQALISRTQQTLQLETPDPILNRCFSLAKLRALESIYETDGGLMHSPGGGVFYAAVWTNDQAEYAGPFFPYTGDPDAIEASMNAYRLYMPFMGPDYTMLPASIIAEGIDIWEGAGDRGDAAMYAYGATLFALTRGDRLVAKELWPAIEWCLEYCRRQENEAGVIGSDSDELEGRFPAGKANLSTSALAYGAYVQASQLAVALG